jgi:hypothetical protein
VGWAGVRGLNAWRIETVGRRKTELAEEVLAAFHCAKDVLTWARFPASDDDDEKDDVRAGPGGNDDELDRSEIFTPVDRLTKESQVFSDLQAARYRFMGYLGRRLHGFSRRSGPFTVRSTPRPTISSIPTARSRRDWNRRSAITGRQPLAGARMKGIRLRGGLTWR